VLRPTLYVFFLYVRRRRLVIGDNPRRRESPGIVAIVNKQVWIELSAVRTCSILLYNFYTNKEFCVLSEVFYFIAVSVAFASENARISCPTRILLLPGITFWGLVRDGSYADDGYEEAKADRSGADGVPAERSGRVGDSFFRLFASSGVERNTTVERGTEACAAGVCGDVAPARRRNSAASAGYRRTRRTTDKSFQ